jgi:hypothetical protein
MREPILENVRQIILRDGIQGDQQNEDEREGRPEVTFWHRV